MTRARDRHTYLPDALSRHILPRSPSFSPHRPNRSTQNIDTRALCSSSSELQTQNIDTRALCSSSSELQTQNTYEAPRRTAEVRRPLNSCLLNGVKATAHLNAAHSTVAMKRPMKPGVPVTSLTYRYTNCKDRQAKRHHNIIHKQSLNFSKNVAATTCTRPPGVTMSHWRTR